MNVKEFFVIELLIKKI